MITVGDEVELQGNSYNYNPRKVKVLAEFREEADQYLVIRDVASFEVVHITKVKELIRCDCIYQLEFNRVECSENDKRHGGRHHGKIPHTFSDAELYWSDR